MPNEIVEIVNCARYGLMYLCLSAMVAVGCVLVLAAFGNSLHVIYRKWLRLDRIGRVMLATFVCGMWMHGSTKNVTWSRRANAGSDSDLGVVNIMSMQTNIVSNAGATTNNFTAVRVTFIGNAVTTNTPFWVRNSTSNDWERIGWASASITSDLSTNVMECVAATNISSTIYWWLGDDLPAVEVETIGITLLNVVESSTAMRFVFTCDNANAQTFYVEYQTGSNNRWNVAAQAEATATNEVLVQGFWIGETRRWRIRSEIESDTEDE